MLNAENFLMSGGAPSPELRATAGSYPDSAKGFNRKPLETWYYYRKTLHVRGIL